jgi:hypothetical protein
MRKLTVKSSKRTFIVKGARRKVYGSDSNRQTYAVPSDSTWNIVGTPNLTLDQVLGTLEDNVIVR